MQPGLEVAGILWGDRGQIELLKAAAERYHRRLRSTSGVLKNLCENMRWERHRFLVRPGRDFQWLDSPVADAHRRSPGIRKHSANISHERVTGMCFIRTAVD